MLLVIVCSWFSAYRRSIITRNSSFPEPESHLPFDGIDDIIVRIIIPVELAAPMSSPVSECCDLRMPREPTVHDFTLTKALAVLWFMCTI